MSGYGSESDSELVSEFSSDYEEENKPETSDDDEENKLVKPEENKPEKTDYEEKLIIRKWCWWCRVFLLSAIISKHWHETIW